MCLTQGLTKNCAEPNQAGTEDKLYLIPAQWLDEPAFTVDPNGSLSAISIDLVASGGVTGFYSYDLRRDANGYRGELAGEQPNLYIEQTVTAIIDKMNQDTRNVIQEWLDCRCGLVAIVVDNNCKQWVLGVSYNAACAKFQIRGLRVAAGSAEQTGVDPTADQNQYEVTLTTNSFELAREYSGVIPLA